MTNSEIAANNELMFPMGEKLRAIRAKADISARKLAAYSDITWPTYKAWEYNYKKDTLPVEVVKKMHPVLSERGVPETEIWALAGVNTDPFKGAGEISVTLDNGSIATGIAAPEWSNPSSTALVRYVGPGLVIAVELNLGGKKTTKAYDIEKIGDRFAFNPLNEKVKEPLFFQPGQEWFHGEVSRGKLKGTAHILLVVQTISNSYNQDFV